MENLKFPIFNEELPPPRQTSIKTYLEFVRWHLNRMGSTERKRSERPIPTGKRFTLFPKD